MIQTQSPEFTKELLPIEQRLVTLQESMDNLQLAQSAVQPALARVIAGENFES